MEVKKVFAQRIIELRKEKGLTQGGLARKVDVSKTSANLYESATRVPDIQVLARYAKELGVTSDYLLGLTDKQQPGMTLVGQDGNVKHLTLIDADKYRADMEKSLELMARAGDSQDDIACGMRRAIRLLDMQDVVEAAEVKHGEWDAIPNTYMSVASKDGSYSGNATSCSVCHEVNPNVYKTNFCPNCGAKMDGKELGK